MAWLSGWSKRQAIVLTGGSSGAQVDFQVELTVAYESDMKSDFSDLRFTKSDGTTLLDAWMESYTASTSATVWVETDTPENTVESDIYMYYGKADALSDWNFDGTFIFGDPFNNTALNTTRWTTVDGNPIYTIDAINHYLEITDMDESNWCNGKGFHSKTTLSLPSEWIIEDAYSSDGLGMYHDSGANGDMFGSIFSLHNDAWSDSNYGIGFFHNQDAWGNAIHVINTAGVGGNEDYSSGEISPSLPITYAIKIWKTGGNIHITEDTTERVNEANSETPDRIHLGIERYSTYSFGTKRFYAFKVRKYADNPPTYGFGSEENAPTGLTILDFERATMRGAFRGIMRGVA